MSNPADEYRRRFKRCGAGVEIAPDVFIEHPERIEVGDHVRFMRSFHLQDGPAVTRIGSHVTFYPNCFIQGSAARLLIDDHVDFFPNQYISTGGENSWIEIGHHTHFAPNCVLYGWGGLKIGPYCNIAAHCVFATIGHDQIKRGDQPMALVKPVPGPITLVEDVWLCANVTV